jgi:hypothetical protein
MTENLPLRRLLTELETATYLCVKPETLATWRSTRRYALPYVRVGRAIRYKPADVERFLAERTVGTDPAGL